MNPLKQSQREKLCKGGNKDLSDKVDEMVNWINLHDIDNNVESQDIMREMMGMDRPMGVSKWMRHGKEYGYWDYFKKEIIKEFIKKASSGI